MTQIFQKNTFVQDSLDFRAWIAWLVSTLFYAYQYILRVIPVALGQDIFERSNMTFTDFGQFAGIYYIGYVIAHIPIGIALNRYSTRIVMIACALLTLISLLSLLYAQSLFGMLLGRLLAGIGSSAGILCVFQVIRSTFSTTNFASMLSVSVTISFLGALYGGLPISYVYHHFGYDSVINSLIVLGLITIFLMYCFLPTSAKKDYQYLLTWGKLKRTLSDKSTIRIGIFSGLMIGPLEGFADVWGVEFLSQVYEISEKQASFLSSLIFLGMCLGSPILGFVADRSDNLDAIIIIAGFIMIVIFSLLLFGLIPISILPFAFLLTGLCCSYQIVIMRLISISIPPHKRGIVSAFVNMIIMMFGYYFHSAIGIITHFLSGINNEHSITYGISIIPLFGFVGMIGFMFFKYDERGNLERNYVIPS